MNGVVILNEIEAVIDHTIGFSVLGTLMIIWGLILIGVEIFLVSKKRIGKKDFNLIAPLCIIFMGATLFLNAKPVTETQYEIYVPGEINMREFSEKYEITGRRGLIYTVRDMEFEIEEKGR